MLVVFADDSYPMRERLRAWLRNCGQVVVGEANSAREVLVVCERVHPDLAILDILMPPGDGRSMAVKIAEEKLAKAVLVVTSNSQKAIIDELKPKGIHLLFKPLGETQFATMVRFIENKLNQEG